MTGFASSSLNPHQCNACGEQWPHHPALFADCPDCHAKAGACCVRPSGHACPPHAARERAAVLEGKLLICTVLPVVDGVGFEEKAPPKPQAPKATQGSLF